ncbi:MAG: hypothetical protein MR051_03280 [Lentisphaeria bacterium]|nr:hypothetical protein [Lentisphaeria bacterium]
MMKAFRAIVFLTFRSALRSHVFQLLLALLLLAVTLIPISVSVGKAEEFIRISLLYSLWAVSIVLALSSLWLGCFVMSRDIDNYQIHMVVSKPVSRVMLWLGKWTGINLIHLALLLISGLTVYGIVTYRYRTAGEESRYAERQSERTRAEAEKEHIRTKILVGRRSYSPRLPDAKAVADAEVGRRAAEAVRKGSPLSDGELQTMREEIIRRVTDAPLEVRPGQPTPQTWVFENVPVRLNDIAMYLRYRPYLGKVSSEDQRQTYLWWEALMPQVNPETGKFALYPRALSPVPEQVFSGAFLEKILPPGTVAPDGTVTVLVSNFDRYGAKHYYQRADGPKLLVPVCSFEENFLRGLLVMTIQLLLLSGLACAFGGFLTMPTAVFMAASYLLFGSFSMVLTDSEFFADSALDHFSQLLARGILLVVIPLQKFDITDLLAGGDLIEFSLIGELFLQYFVLRGAPLFLLGIWLYRRREMGAAVRK